MSPNGSTQEEVDARSMPPPAPRPPKRPRTDAPVVLEEEEWLSKMETIIERDFFPELGKLQDKVAWLEAVRSGDPERIRHAQLRISQRHLGQSGAANTSSRTPYTEARLKNIRGLETPGNNALGCQGEAAVADVPANMSLDAFLARHTSEDNAGFQQILERTNKKRREKLAAIFAPPNSQNLLITDGSENGKQTPLLEDGRAGVQPGTTIHSSNNLLMYGGSTALSLPFSEKELAARARGPPPSINHRATRLASSDPTNNLPATSTTSGDTESISMTEDSAGGGNLVKQQRPQRGRLPPNPSYDILATPSFEPGVDASPFITWGDIDATPMRIEAEDLPMGQTSAFRLKETSKREQKAHAMAANKSAQRRKTDTGMTPARAAALAALGKSPGVIPGRGAGGATPLSHAAQRLASRLNKSSGRKDFSQDSALRASYRKGTGGGRTAAATPSRLGGWDSGSATPKQGTTGGGDWTPASS